MEDKITRSAEEIIKDNQGDSEKTSIQSGKLELKQTNIVSFNSEVESVVIDKRHIQTIRNICKAEQDEYKLIDEIFLAVSMLFAGAFMSAILSKVEFVFSWMAVLYYVVSPVIAVGCFVAFCFKRKTDIASKKQLAEHILEYLPKEEG